ncbi:hypothetical protein CGMCC3_g17852 [Colletotrichum fructicola]|nr:uncharacterized protein CGMCC3_g17852 [Colletotrichum fructicola]KAE9565970.1 hypothetical protein CGMCC3_g17852 [Colletotrichum fructicola]
MDRCSAFGKTLSHDSLDPPNPMAHLLEGSRNIDKVNGKVISVRKSGMEFGSSPWITAVAVALIPWD